MAGAGDRRDELIAATLGALGLPVDLIGEIARHQPTSMTQAASVLPASALGVPSGRGVSGLINALAREFIQAVGFRRAQVRTKCYNCPVIGECMTQGLAQTLYRLETAPRVPEPGATIQTVHFRLWSKVKDGGMCEPDEYARMPHGGLTLTFLAHPKEGREVVWYMGPAACSIDDEFDRDIGYHMSLERALLTRHMVDYRYRYGGDRDVTDHRVAYWIAQRYVEKETGLPDGKRGYLRDWDRKIAAEVKPGGRIVLAAWDAVTGQTNLGCDDLGYGETYNLDPAWFVKVWEPNDSGC